VKGVFVHLAFLLQHVLRVDVKAVTLHRFRVIQESGLWKATVVLDI
jgi:SHS2 domain-containing protein